MMKPWYLTCFQLDSLDFTKELFTNASVVCKVSGALSWAHHFPGLPALDYVDPMLRTSRFWNMAQNCKIVSSSSPFRNFKNTCMINKEYKMNYKSSNATKFNRSITMASMFLISYNDWLKMTECWSNPSIQNRNLSFQFFSVQCPGSRTLPS